MNNKIKKHDGNVLRIDDKLNEVIGMINQHTDKINEIIQSLSKTSPVLPNTSCKARLKK